MRRASSERIVKLQLSGLGIFDAVKVLRTVMSAGAQDKMKGRNRAPENRCDNDQNGHNVLNGPDDINKIL